MGNNYLKINNSIAKMKQEIDFSGSCRPGSF